ncbi:unnamed protein product, partial [Prorocentrum cordatum]
EHVAKSLAVHARDAAKVGERAGALADEQRRMRAQIDDIEKTLAMAENETPIIDFQALEACSRLPDARIFSAGAPELVGPAQVRAGISDWLTAAGIDKTLSVSTPPPPESASTLSWGAGWTSPFRVLKRWLDICVALRSPQQVRMEIQTRRLANILSEAVPGQAFSAQRARGIITSQGVKLAELEMGGRREAGTATRWNVDMVSRMAIDRDAIAEQSKKAFSLEDRTEWPWHFALGSAAPADFRLSLPRAALGGLLQPQRYLSFLAAVSSPGVGGVAFLAPQMPAASSPGVAPAFSFDLVIPDRIEAQWPTHFDKASQQLSVIDRIFLGIDTHAMLSVSTRLTTACDSMELSEPGLSDHAPLVLQIEMARHVPREEQATPSHLLFHPKYPDTFVLMMANSDLEAASVEDRWRAYKTCMTSAAGRIRDEQLRTKFSLKARDGNAETTYMGFKTAARALWRQDAPLAARLLALCTDLSARLVIDQGSVRVADARAFAEAFDAAAAKVHAMRRQAAEVVSDSAGMTGVVAEYWGKIFERTPTVEQKLRLNQFLDRFAPQLPVVELPQPSLRALGSAAARAPPSAPGPDQLPYAAWRRSPGARLHLHALMEQLFNEGAGPHDLNWSIFLCVPKGAEDEDTPGLCTRTASIVRTLSLKNADAKLIASCADRALQPIASAATEGVQKGFTAGRRFVDHTPFLDAECRREGLLPGAAQRRPMLLSFGFRQALPPLFRDVIDIVLPRYGAPLGFCGVISALRCNCHAFSSFRVSGGSAAMGPPFALRCGIMQGCPLSGTVWRPGVDAPIRALIEALGDPPEGCLTARAGDLGMLIRNAKTPPFTAESFEDIEFAFNLQLAIHKCALVPLWAEVTPNLINDTEALLAEMAPSWRGFRVDSSAKYLGTRIGPGISEQGIWKDAAAKWRSRAAEMSRAGTAASLAARAYNVNVFPCLSYLAQFFFIAPEIWRVEFTMPHRLPRLPLSAMRKADILSMGAWCGPPAPMGLLPHSVGALLRAAAHTARDWAPTLRALHDTAAENPPLASVLKGSWSPPRWATKRSIVQNYGLVMDKRGALPHPRPVIDRAPAPAPMPIIEAARSAMGDEEQVKRQAAAMRTIRDGLYEERLDQLIGRRLRRWSLEMPAEELRGRWLELRAELRAARPAWMWSRLRTITNGWITSGRMHVIAPRPCIMGYEARDDLSHYMARPVLRGAVASPAEASELGSGATFLGL